MPASGTTLQLLPERIDLPALVLTAAGLGALFGALVNHLEDASGEAGARRTERLALGAAGWALAVAIAMALVQKVF